jgi:hypothetical protein
MEVFVVAHEYGHFLLDENPSIDFGISPSDVTTLSQQQQLELKCDKAAILISRAYGANRGNWMSTILGGALSFFVAHEICLDARQLVWQGLDYVSDTHPVFEHRLAELVRFHQSLLTATEKKHVSGDCLYVLTMLQALHVCVIDDVERIVHARNDPPSDS